MIKTARQLPLRSASYLAAGLALALCPIATHSAWAQFPPPPPMMPGGSAGVAPSSPPAGPPGGVQCNDFVNLTTEAKKRSDLVGAAVKNKAERKELCTLMTNFVTAESKVMKFLEDNKKWCGVPDQIIAASRAGHEKALKFRTAACEEGPHPKTPTLSDAIKAPTVDSAKNTKTGRGTFDTLTGNPLAR